MVAGLSALPRRPVERCRLFPDGATTTPRDRPLSTPAGDPWSNRRPLGGSADPRPPRRGRGWTRPSRPARDGI